ncbi:MAG: hypothetical protein ACYSWP_12080 [Planctomycetota bacterium]|jgi:hypothetical protein
MTPQELAEKVTEFIKFNNIDTNQYTLEEITEAYFKMMFKSTEEAGQKLSEQGHI